MHKSKLAAYLEATNLSPVARREEIEQLCQTARAYDLIAVCVLPYYVRLAASLLQDSEIKVVTVVGFPLGGNDGLIKAREAELAVQYGAAEVDMVMNLAAFKNGDHNAVIKDIAAVVSSSAIVKLIIETGYLSEEEIVRACCCAEEGGVHYIKTCSGFGPRGVSLDDVRVIRSQLSRGRGIKAAAGIKTAAFARKLIAAGANRLGTSLAWEILKQEAGEKM